MLEIFKNNHNFSYYFHYFQWHSHSFFYSNEKIWNGILTGKHSLFLIIIFTPVYIKYFLSSRVFGLKVVFLSQYIIETSVCVYSPSTALYLSVWILGLGAERSTGALVSEYPASNPGSWTFHHQNIETNKVTSVALKKVYKKKLKTRLKL